MISALFFGIALRKHIDKRWYGNKRRKYNEEIEASWEQDKDSGTKQKGCRRRNKKFQVATEIHDSMQTFSKSLHIMMDFIDF